MSIPNMGLRKGLKIWGIPAGISLAALAAALGGEAALAALRYDRGAIAAGEAWRLVSGHFAHLGWPHLGLNIAGLLLVWYLVGAAWSRRQWLGILLVAIVVMDGGFWFLLPALDWYVGLSGLLHAVVVAGVLGGWRRRPAEAGLIAAAVAAKLAWEAYAGPMPGSVATAGGTVVTEAHLFGAIGGLLAALPLAIRYRHDSTI